MCEKLAHRVHAHPALEPKSIQRGDQQARQPLPALGGFPQPRLRIEVSALPSLCKTMHATLGQTRLLGHAAHALPAVVTKTLENPDAFLPKSHVGRLSEGCLNSCWNSV